MARANNDIVATAEAARRDALSDALNVADIAIAQMAHGLCVLRDEVGLEAQHNRVHFLIDALELMRKQCDDSIQASWKAVGVEGVHSV